jgi:hypothetical protein
MHLRALLEATPARSRQAFVPLAERSHAFPRAPVSNLFSEMEQRCSPYVPVSIPQAKIG